MINSNKVTSIHSVIGDKYNNSDNLYNANFNKSNKMTHAFDKSQLNYFKNTPRTSYTERIKCTDVLRDIFDEMILFGSRQRTIESYEHHFLKMMEISGVEYIDELNRQVLKKYLALNDVANSTRLVRFKSVSAILNRMFDMGYIESKFWKNIKIKVDRSIKQPTDTNDLYKFIYQLDFNQFAQYRDACYLLFLYHTGVRLRTASLLTVDMIDMDNRVIHFTGDIMKNHNGLTLPIPEEMVEMLKVLILENDNRFPDNKYVFVTEKGKCFVNERGHNYFPKRLAKYRKRYEMNNITPHAIRRAFAMNLLNNGVSVPVISKALNHSNLEVTTQYLYVDNKEVVDTIRDLQE